jgi:putative tricarboxylic transport membrane protein
MDGLGNSFIAGIEQALTLYNLLYAFIGCVAGTLVGVLPGLGPAATTAILLPLTANVPVDSAIIMLASIYYGAMYGGSTTSILVNVPGETASVVTTLDGFQMTKQGRAGQALFAAAVGSFIAGTVGVIGLSLIGSPLAKVAIRFGPLEYFALVLFSLTALVSFSEESILKGLASCILGLFIAAIGIDPMSGSQRLTFGVVALSGGFDVIPIVMGLFGVAEVLASYEEGTSEIFKGSLGRIYPPRDEMKKGFFACLRGTLVGFFLGLLPGMGPSISSFLSYDIEKRFSRDPSSFGKGCIEGVAAPESANNAAGMSGFIPLMSLGIPTTPTLAIILAALMIHGLRPGPTLFLVSGNFAWTVIGSMYIGNFMLLILNLPLVGLWARVSLIPYRFLSPLILGISFIGAYVVRNSMFDVLTLVVFSVAGFYLKKLAWPTAPMILGIILGPSFEQSIRQSFAVAGGSMGILSERPIAIGLFLLAIVMPIAAFCLKRRRSVL